MAEPENADERPQIKYKVPWASNTKLKPTSETYQRLRALAQIQCTQKEAAAVMGCSASAMEKFIARNPEAAEAWHSGKEEGRASLRRLLWKQAQSDPGQARFLARQKPWLDMNDDRASNTSVDVNVTASLDGSADRIELIERLQSRVIIDGEAEEIEEEPRTIEHLVKSGQD